MRNRPRWGVRGVVAATLACAVWSASPARAEPEESQTASDIQKLYYEGAAAYSASDYDGAIKAFTKALAAASREHTEPRIREALLMNLGKAYEGKFEIDQDTVHLRTARDIYRRLVREAPDNGYGERVVGEAKDKVAELDARLSELQPTEHISPTDPAAPDPAPPSTSDTAPGKRGRGIALLVSGIAGIGGGVALIANGARFRSHAEAEVEQYDDPADVEQKFVDDEVKRGRIQMGVGGGLAAVGTGLLVWGAVDLARAKKGSRSAARVRGGPLVGRQQGGMWLHVGF